MKNQVVSSAVIALLSLTSSAYALVDFTYNQQTVNQQYPVQFIVKAASNKQAINQSNLVQTVAQAVGVPMQYARTMSTGDIIVRIDTKKLNSMNAKQQSYEILNIEKKIAQLPQVAQVQYDAILTMQSTPDVLEFDKQWDMYEATAGINGPAAWDITTGSKDVVIGVVDTGIVKHENFVDEQDSQKVLPGFSFVRYNTDVTDEGVHAGDRVVFHGTHVAGTIGGSVGADHHVAGVAWHTRILPVQVLGANGAGMLSQILDGMRWAAGLEMKNGIPNNPNPAKVLNMSLGGESLIKLPFIRACALMPLMQDVVNEIVEHGTALVVAAGNGDREGKPADAINFFPASCEHVITVASVGRDGKRAFYSNYGSVVDLAAPGGDQGRVVNGHHEYEEGGIYSTTAIGHYEYYQGTSMAAPHVAGVAALMLAVNPDLTPEQIRQGLTESAHEFLSDDSQLSCSNGWKLCGAGVVDAHAAVLWAKNHLKKAA